MSNEQMVHESVPTVPVTEATVESIADGSIIPRLNAGIKNGGDLIVRLDRFPVGSKFKLTLDITFELHEDRQSVFVAANTSLKLPPFAGLNTRLFIGKGKALVTPVLPGDKDIKKLQDGNKNGRKED